MSTLNTNYLKHPSSTANNLTLTSTGDVVNAAGQSLAPSGRNLLYNGAMQVAQRGTSTASITTGGYYTADRWQLTGVAVAGTWTQSIENDAPTGSGLRKSLRMLCTTANASVASGTRYEIATLLEGLDLQRIAKGTASAQQLTLSFWVKSNVTGTYIVWLYDFDNNRMVSGSYSVSSSATWEKKSITFPADTTGAFDNDNAASMEVAFILAAGSTYTSGTLATSWQTGSNANVAPGQVNLAAATNNYWQITGVQLEVGSQATSFEFEDFGTTLRKCQRYYFTTTAGSLRATAYADAALSDHVVSQFFPVTMRGTPSVTITSPSTALPNSQALGAVNISPEGFGIDIGSSSGAGARGYYGTGGKITAISEL